MGCGRGSLVKLCGLRGIKFYHPHTSVITHSAGVSVHPVLPATQVVVSLNRDAVERAKYTSNNLSGVWCDRCDWHGIEARVSMLFACVGRHGGLLSPTSCLFRAFQVASKDRPWDNYRRYALFRTEGVLVYVHWWLRATVAVNSVCAGEQRTCQTCVRSPYCPTSCHFMTKKRH